MRSGLEGTSGRDYGAWVTSGNWVRHALTRPMLAAPGEDMEYSTGNTHLLSAILTKATGAAPGSFANDALARPLGFTLPQWPRDPQGIYFGGNDMLMTPRQMLAFGELYRTAAGRRPADRARRPGWNARARAARVTCRLGSAGFDRRRARSDARSQIRLRLVGPRHRRPRHLFRVGLRRPVRVRGARASTW